MSDNRNESHIGTFFATVNASVTGDGNFQNFTFSADSAEYPMAGSLATSILEWARATLMESVNSATRSSTEQADSYCAGGRKFGYDDDPPVLRSAFADKLLFPIMSIIFAFVMAAQVLFHYLQSLPGTQSENDESRYES